MTIPAAPVTATDIRSYLASKGWQRDEDWRGASVWRLGGQARLLVPAGHEYEDDGELLEEAIKKIATYEARPVADVLLDVSEPEVDAQYFRAYPDAPSGTIPLPSALKAVQSIHELMKAAASTVETGARLVIGRRSALVDTFLQRVLLGAAAPGSYVLTARIPTASVGTQALDATQEFSGRAVAMQLHHALRAAHESAEQVLQDSRAGIGSHLDIFSEHMTDGVSADLCKALGDLGGHPRDHPFDIGFAWARGVPGEEPAEALAFTGVMATVLWRAGEDLEILAKSGRARITGRVQELRQRPGEEPRAKIAGVLRAEGGRLRDRHVLWVVLTTEQNVQAIEAYREGWTLDVEGRLSTSQRRLELRVDQFAVLR